tara:strand:+ start:200 stop:433 length:234 start_codon:yes stop_codon:yes gene_type:complete
VEYWRFVIRFCNTLRSKNANNEDMSKPPIGGIIPLNIFKYGSVIEQSADNIPLLQSIPGNQVSKILIMRIKEYIERV